MIAREIIISRYANGWRSWVNAVAWLSPGLESENHCPDGGAGLAAVASELWVEYAGIALFFVAAVLTLWQCCNI